MTEDVEGQIASVSRILELSRQQFQASLAERNEAKSVMKDTKKQLNAQRRASTAIERKIARCNKVIHKLKQESQRLQDEDEEANPFAVMAHGIMSV